VAAGSTSPLPVPCLNLILLLVPAPCDGVFFAPVPVSELPAGIPFYIKKCKNKKYNFFVLSQFFNNNKFKV